MFLFAVLFLTLVPVTFGRIRKIFRKEEEAGVAVSRTLVSKKSEKKSKHKVFNVGNVSAS